jgi:hypothetical protein
MAPSAARADQPAPSNPSQESAPAQDASAVFARGRAQYDQGQYADALVSFRQVLELAPSPNARLYLARTLRRSGQLADAYNEFRRAAQEADQRASTEPRYAATRDAARDEASTLVGSVAFVTMVVSEPPPGAEVRIGDQRTGPAIWGRPLARMPGRVVIETRAPGAQPTRVEVELIAGQDTRVRLPFVTANLENAVQIGFNAAGGAASEERRVETAPVDRGALDASMGGRSSAGPRSVGAGPDAASGAPGPSAWVAVGGVSVGLGLAGVATGIAFTVLAGNRYAALRAQCDPVGSGCESDAAVRAQANEGRTFDTISAVSLAAGSVVTVAGVVMIIGGVLQNEANRAAAQLAAPMLVRVRPTLSPTRDGAQVGVGGVF